MKLLLLGASGQLGRALNVALASLPCEIVVTKRHVAAASDHEISLDVTDGVALLSVLDHVRPRIVVNATAWTNVDGAERDRFGAEKVNFEAVRNIASWSSTNDSLVVHISTDYVFDGVAVVPYKEEAQTNPINEYGRSKVRGERAIIASGARHMIFRTAWLYSANGASFLSTMLRLARESPTLRVVNDQRGTPTSADLVADGIRDAVEMWLRADAPARPALEGTFHLTADGSATWFDFAEAIISGAYNRALIGLKPEVVGIPASEFGSATNRPSYSVLDNSRYKKTFTRELKAWQSVLQETLNDLQRTNGSE